MVSPLLLTTTASLVLLGVVLAAGTVVTWPLWASTPFLAPAYGLLVLGPVAMAVWGSWFLGPGAGTAVSCAVLLAALSVVALRLRSSSRPELVHLVRSSLPPVTVTAGLLLASVALMTLWRTDLNPFALGSIRFTHQLPVDGQIPSMIAERLVAGDDVRTAVPGWLSSDRPPLQAGLLLLAHGVLSFRDSGLVLDAGMSMAAQSLWVLGGWSVARALGASPRATATGLVFVGTSGSLLVNTVFTWPKLLSAALALAAVAIAVQHRRERTGRSRLPETTVLVAMGLLSHGAAVFALPVVLLSMGRVTARLVRSVPLSLAAGLVVYVPWLAYQRFYDPPGDRLLSWHLAGVVEPTAAGFLEDLGHAYKSTELSTLLANKLANLDYVFGRPPVPLSSADWTLSGLRSLQFYTTSGALGLTWVPMTALLAVALVHLARRRTDPFEGRVLGTLAACGVGLMFWCLVMFGPATTYVHQGSHVPIILAGSLSTAWVAQRSRWSAAALVGSQLAATALVYGPTNGGAGLTDQIQLTAVAALVVSVAVLGVAVTMTHNEPEATPWVDAVEPGPLPPTPSPGDRSSEDDATDTRPMGAQHAGVARPVDPSTSTRVLVGLPVGPGRRSAPPPPPP